MINKRNLFILLLFSVILISSISVIGAADSDASNLQTDVDEEIDLEQGGSDLQTDLEKESESDQSDSKDVLSKTDSFSDRVQSGEYKTKTIIVADNITTFPEEGNIFFKLADENGNPLEGCNVTLDLEHIHRNFVTNSSGEGYFAIKSAGKNLEVGNYTGVIKFKGNENYNESSLNISIKIRTLNSAITCNNLSFFCDESGILTAWLNDSEGNPIENASLKLVIGSILDTLKTDSNGRVDFNLSGKLSPGSYDGHIYFDLTNRYSASNVPVTVKVNKIPTEISAFDMNFTYGEVKYLVLTLKDKYGNPIANESVNVKLGIESLTGRTDADGHAKFLIDLTPRHYIATISFAGNEIYQASNSALNIAVKSFVEITANDLTNVYNKDKYLTVTFKDNHGNAIDGIPVTVELNGKVMNYKTDGKGKVKFSTASLVPNTYRCKIVFSGDNRYKCSYLTFNIFVKKATPKLSASKKKFKVKSTKRKYTVSLKDNQNKAMAKTKVTLKVKGKLYMATTNAKGHATFKIKNLKKKGNFAASVKFAGNAYYNAVTKNVKIIVK